MRGGPDGAEFVCSETSLLCAKQRLIRFTPWLLAPCGLRRVDGGEDGPQMVPWVTWAQLAKVVERVEKYEHHGFSFGPRERAEAALERATRFPGYDWYIN